MPKLREQYLTTTTEQERQIIACTPFIDRTIAVDQVPHAVVDEAWLRGEDLLPEDELSLAGILWFDQMCKEVK